MPILTSSGTSPSLAPVTATANGVTVTVSSDSPNARLLIDLKGGTAGQPVYVLRRDSNGTSEIRETSAGTVLWQSGTPTTVPTISEYEARQGLQTDIIVTDLNGSALVTARVVVPTWGTWLKSPGKPFLNLKCWWKSDSDYTRAGRTAVLQPRGAKYPIALSDRRVSPIGPVQLLTMTAADEAAMVSLLDDGQVLMVDADAAYGIPVRYVSVNDVRVARATAAIHDTARIWTLDVTEVAAPIGLPAGQGFTYASLPGVADTYISLAASFASYNDLAADLPS